MKLLTQNLSTRFSTRFAATVGATLLSGLGGLAPLQAETCATRTYQTYQVVVHQPAAYCETTIRTKTNHCDGAKMVWVPAGEFTRGSNGYDADEAPARHITLSGYWIYQDEVTYGQYRKFCAATHRALPTAPGWADGCWKDSVPVVNITWHDAAAYCAWAGGQLPSEAQWEKAARGAQSYVYPWGNTYSESKAQRGASYSPYGCLNLTGDGVQEWCADFYSHCYYATSPASNPCGPQSTGDGYHVVRGDRFDSGQNYGRAAFRSYARPALRDEYVGFRVVVR